MPYVWIEPAAYLSHGGVAIYHIYKNNFEDEGVRENWFTTDVCGGDCDDPCAFDIRDLSAYAADKPYTQILCEAIDSGELQQEMPLNKSEV